MSRLIYDPNRRNVLIFASTTSDPSRAETWTWDGRALKRASPEAIPFEVTELLYVVPDEAGHILALGWNWRRPRSIMRAANQFAASAFSITSESLLRVAQVGSP